MQEMVEEYVLFAESTLDTAGQLEAYKTMLRKIAHGSWSTNADFPAFDAWRDRTPTHPAIHLLRHNSDLVAPAETA